MCRLNVLYAILVFSVLCETFALADTVYLKSGEEMKGIVVEDYKDRIIISTYEGEKTVLKKDIRSLRYDLMEQNLVKLGDKCMSRNEFGKAYFCYKKAHEINTEYGLAREKMNYLTGYFFRKRGQEKLDHVKRMEEFENWLASRLLPDVDFQSELEANIGIRIGEKENRIYIKRVLKNSPAYSAGLREGETLIAVWGHLTGYMPTNEVADFLLNKSLGEVKIVAERDIELKKEPSIGRNYADVVGGKLNMLIDGLTLIDVTDGGPGQKAGLKKYDVIVAINGASTRYMPFKDAVKIIEDRDSSIIVFTVRRNMTIWRR